MKLHTYKSMHIINDDKFIFKWLDKNQKEELILIFVRLVSAVKLSIYGYPTYDESSSGDFSGY
jgi:hypothetical protein